MPLQHIYCFKPVEQYITNNSKIFLEFRKQLVIKHMEPRIVYKIQNMKFRPMIKIKTCVLQN